MEAILVFLGANAAAFAAIVSILEAVVVLVNLLSKFRKKKEGEVETMTASPSKFQAFLWVINPVNVFRKPR